jgi:hypothetical protein
MTAGVMPSERVTKVELKGKREEQKTTLPKSYQERKMDSEG